VAKVICVHGELVGQRLSAKTGQVIAEVVHVTSEQRPEGPAENAFLLVEIGEVGRNGRYISWINYFDLDYASAKERNSWRLVEPAREYTQNLFWMPFGWPGANRVPTIGDSALAKEERIVA
jgi:hypothetical protein